MRTKINFKVKKVNSIVHDFQRNFSCQKLFQILEPVFTLGYCLTSHANIITDSTVMTIFVYEGLTRSPEI